MTLDFEKVLLIQHLQDIVSAAKTALASEGGDDWTNLKVTLWDAQAFLYEIKEEPYNG
jgi:hypothetical protein